jgi:Uma2 family endonuclease
VEDIPISTVDRQDPAATIPLEAGQHLDQTAFHERYERMPPKTRAELIGGVVSMLSPVGPEHADQNAPVVYWLCEYEAATPGVRVSINASTALDDESELQPDCALRILTEFGGRTRIERAVIVGAPELVVEIARTSRDIDLGPKLEDYQRAGVREYVVVALEPDESFWFGRRNDHLERLEPAADGLFRSAAFPGLWLDPAVLFSRNFHRLRAVLGQGLASPEHAEFVAQLSNAAQCR